MMWEEKAYWSIVAVMFGAFLIASFIFFIGTGGNFLAFFSLLAFPSFFTIFSLVDIYWEEIKDWTQKCPKEKGK